MILLCRVQNNDITLQSLECGSQVQGLPALPNHDRVRTCFTDSRGNILGQHRIQRIYTGIQYSTPELQYSKINMKVQYITTKSMQYSTVHIFGQHQIQRIYTDIQYTRTAVQKNKYEGSVHNSKTSAVRYSKYIWPTSNPADIYRYSTVNQNSVRYSFGYLKSSIEAILMD